MARLFQTVTANLVGKPRFAVMEGRDFIVLPVTILVEGVHNGSNGPILYTLEDMEKYAAAWSHKPVVVYHPKKGGQFVSADDPAILTSSKVGILMNVHTSGNSLVAEAWLEVSRITQVDTRIKEAIDKGLVVEVSTGLFSDNEDVSGKWNGEEYVSIARNYRPDHLALLPDLVGACSIADGCGMFTAAQAMTLNQAEEIQTTLKRVFSGNKCADDSGGDEEKKKKKSLRNEMSHGELYHELYEAISERIGATLEAALGELPEGTPQPRMPWVDVYEVYDDYCIYACGGEEDDLYKQEYKKTKDGVDLVGDPIEVERQVSYAPVSNNEELIMPTTNCGECKEIKALVDCLISANAEWTEDDRQWLSSQDEPILKKLIAMNTVKEEKKIEKELEKEIEVVAANTEATTPKKKVSVEEYIKEAPGPIREVLARGLAAHQAERKRLTDIILSNENNQFSEQELTAMEVPSLQKLAALAVHEEEEKPQALDLFSYIGQSGSPQANVSNEEHLPLPKMTFNKK